MVILMAGLQGVGKTTACGKLANLPQHSNGCLAWLLLEAELGGRAVHAPRRDP